MNETNPYLPWGECQVPSGKLNLDRQKDMKKKTTIVSLCALLFALCGSVSAQQPKKVHRIGYLSTGDSASESARSEAVRLALRDLGYIEGQNIAIEYRYTHRKLRSGR